MSAFKLASVVMVSAFKLVSVATMSPFKAWKLPTKTLTTSASKVITMMGSPHRRLQGSRAGSSTGVGMMSQAWLACWKPLHPTDGISSCGAMAWAPPSNDVPAGPAHLPGQFTPQEKRAATHRIKIFIGYSWI